MPEIPEIISSFLVEIGLDITYQSISKKTFLPGILIRHGGLVIDREALLYAGDILHEAGHLAVMPYRIRKTMNDDLANDPVHQGGELMAIAWSYAACVHLKIDPHIVFHEEGYKSGGKDIVKNFSEGRYFGVALLQWQGMCYEKEPAPAKTYPHMIEWLCKQDNYVLEENATIK